MHFFLTIILPAFLFLLACITVFLGAHDAPDGNETDAGFVLSQVHPVEPSSGTRGGVWGQEQEPES